MDLNPKICISTITIPFFRPQAGLLFGPKGPSEAEIHDTNTIAISFKLKY